jgi:uncharacterized membrane protein YesL
MPIFRYRGNILGPGVPENEPPKRGLSKFFFVFYRDFFNLAKLSMLFALFCLPVFTIPAAITAMCKITFKMACNKPYFLRVDFWETFKTEFWRSLVYGWLLIVGIALCVACIYASVIQVNDFAFLYVPLVVSSIVVVLLIMTSFYLFVMFAAIDLPAKQALKNAVLLSLSYQPYNIAALGIIAALSYLVIYLLPVSVVLLPLFLFAFMNYIATFCASSGLEKYVICSGDKKTARQVV